MASVSDVPADTRSRLLAAAVASCVELGFEGATVADIARRADVSAPAIYNHFGGKVDLLVAAGRWALDELAADSSQPVTPAGVVRMFLAPGFADTRRLLSELHLASQRHPDVADLLAKWHGDHGDRWAKRSRGRGAAARQADVKAFFALLLGLAQIDALSSLDVPSSAIESRAVAMTELLFPKDDA